MAQDGGLVQSVIVLDFRNQTGILVIASVPENVESARADEVARQVYEAVVKAECTDYERYSDGRFDWERCIQHELQSVGSEILSYTDNLFC